MESFILGVVTILVIFVAYYLVSLFTVIICMIGNSVCVFFGFSDSFLDIKARDFIVGVLTVIAIILAFVLVGKLISYIL